MITAIAFYAFSAVLLASATMVISARNPVHAALYLILAFFNAAALFLIAGAEFLAMILVIVYVGAVAVLFLFVVMMLDVGVSQMRLGLQRYAPLGLAVGLVLLIELAMVLSGWTFAEGSAGMRFAPVMAGVTNTTQLGRVIYTDYVFLFQASGLVLLVAMIGAIVLTLRDRSPHQTGVRPSRKQDVARQVARMPVDTLEMVEITAGAPTGAFLKPKIVEAPEPAHHDTHAGHGGH
jgi:NADH-quinone oxidoreductase subunit J